MIKINKDNISVKGNSLRVLGEFMTAIDNFKNINWNESLPIEIANVVTVYTDSIKEPINLLAKLGALLKEFENETNN